MDEAKTPQTEMVLRFIELTNPSPVGNLVLIQHPRPFDFQTHQVHYRQNGDWIPFSATHNDGWEFLDEDHLAADYIDMLEYYWHEVGAQDGVVTNVLWKSALEWYDSFPSEDQNVHHFKRFTSDTHNFEIRFLNNDRCEVSLVAGNMLWSRAPDGEWTFQEHLTTKTRQHRAILRGVATSHLKRAIDLYASEKGLAADEARYTAFSFGAPLPIGPTFEDSLLSLAEAGELHWDTVKTMLDLDDAAEGPFAFVSSSDPVDGSDFRLDDLVMGHLDDGNGARRSSGMWIKGYVGVLDWENHMPADEGDMSPWGGQYLYDLDDDTADLAIAFWDLRTQKNTKPYFSDFIVWLRRYAVSAN